MTTFISYSRRQLYFAESLALTLQQEGVDVWFDLQQLQAGTVWSDGLKDGVSIADRLILIVSKASLASAYTQAEWQGVAARQRELILVLYEPVDLPEELQGLPTFDFRSGFNSKLKQLVTFLGDGKDPQRDRITEPSRLGVASKMPAALWATLLVLLAPLMACLLPLLGVLLTPLHSLPEALEKSYFYIIVAGGSLLIGLRYAFPLLHHKLEYKKLKRACLLSLLMQLLAFITIFFMSFNNYSLVPIAGLFAFSVFFYLVTLRRSANLLRWMQPEEALQDFRLRIHQPLVSNEKFDVAVTEKTIPLTYAIHADPADQPFVEHVEQIFASVGHSRVMDDQNPQQHIAVLSNRSSQAWTQELTQCYGGKLVSIVITTIEFKESLKETGRYQWVDARDGDSRDIRGLALSLGGGDTRQREAALEATPAMIDQWKVPTGITIQKRLLEIFAVFIVVFGLTELLSLVIPLFAKPAGETISNVPRSVSLVVLGVVCMWLGGRAFVYRKIAPLALYGFVVTAVVASSLFASLPGAPWFPQVIVLPILLYGAMISLFWLPKSEKSNSDEIGIKESIDRSFTIRNVLVMSCWVILIIGLAAAIQLTLGTA